MSAHLDHLLAMTTDVTSQLIEPIQVVVDLRENLGWLNAFRWTVESCFAIGEEQAVPNDVETDFAG